MNDIKQGSVKHIISVEQFTSISIIDEIFALADKMERDDKNDTLQPLLKGKLLASIFYEPSTRTRFSFEAAMQKLGGNIISTESASHFSSVTKGESLQDTIKTINQYADIIILRHPKEGSAIIAANVSVIPLINAGDGNGEHPTQALLDIYTIKKELGRLNSIKIALIGDLLYGRTIHSLIKLISIYESIKLYLISPNELKLPEKYTSFLKENNIEFHELNSINKVIDKIDVLYITRIQKERFSSQEDYEKVKDSFIINEETLKNLNPNTVIMHPLPRVNELSTKIDADKRAAYFRQAKNGLYIRMALLQMVLK